MGVFMLIEVDIMNRVLWVSFFIACAAQEAVSLLEYSGGNNLHTRIGKLSIDFAVGTGSADFGTIERAPVWMYFLKRLGERLDFMCSFQRCVRSKNGRLGSDDL